VTLLLEAFPDWVGKLFPHESGLEKFRISGL